LAGVGREYVVGAGVGRRIGAVAIHATIGLRHAGSLSAFVLATACAFDAGDFGGLVGTGVVGAGGIVRAQYAVGAACGRDVDAGKFDVFLGAFRFVDRFRCGFFDKARRHKA